MPQEEKMNINGISCYALPNVAAHSFCIGLYVYAGVLYEADTENGITHLFEHTVFRNIKNHYQGRLYELLVHNCLSFNATTYGEFVNFTLRGDRRGFPFALEVLGLIFDEIRIPAGEYDAEKRRIKSEIREESETTTLAYFTDQLVWAGTPLRRTIAGSCGNVDRISRRQLNAYRKSILTKNNLFFCLTGNYTREDECALEEMLSRLDIPAGENLRENMAPVPKDFGHRTFAVHVKNADYYRVKFCFDVDNGKFGAAVRDLLYSLLFKSETAMVHLALSEEKPLVYSFDSSFEQYRNISVLKLEYDVSKRDLQESVCEVFRMCARIKRGQFRFDDLLAWEITASRMWLDEIGETNFSLAYENHILGAEPLCFDDPMLGRYENVTKQDVVDMARAIFRPECMTLAMKGSEKYIASLDLGQYLHLLEE